MSRLEERIKTSIRAATHSEKRKQYIHENDQLKKIKHKTKSRERH